MAEQKRESVEERVARRRKEFAAKKEEFATFKNEVIKPLEDAKLSVFNLSVDIDVDISATITGLKAIQREAKEATKALRELEVAGVDFATGKDHTVFNVTVNTSSDTDPQELSKRIMAAIQKARWQV